MPLPWQLKIAVKLVLARLPVGYAAWKRLGIFEHGAMDDPAYAEAIFLRHLDRAGMRGRAGFTCLELGPGDSLFSAALAKAYGASLCWLVDSGDFATRDMAHYRALLRHLAQQGMPPLQEAASPAALLELCGARYLTGGLASLREIPAGSIDFVWSQAVLEHIRRRDFDATMGELRRILHRDGVASHRVDLRDHLGGALNNLRFSARLWESDWVARSGFYTNRLPYGELIGRFEAAGFAVEVLGAERWASLPTPRQLLAAPFRQMPVAELLVSGFDVLLRPC